MKRTAPLSSLRLSTTNRSPPLQRAEAPSKPSAEIGKVDLIGAIEQSSNPYFAILAGDYLSHPQDLVRPPRILDSGSAPESICPENIKAISRPMSIKTKPAFIPLRSDNTPWSAHLYRQLRCSALLPTAATCWLRRSRKALRERISAHAAARIQKARLFKTSFPCSGIDFPLIFRRCSKKRSSECPADRIKTPQSAAAAFLDPQYPIRRDGSRAMGRKGKRAAQRDPKPRLASENLKGLSLFTTPIIGKTSTAEILWRSECEPFFHPQMYKHIWFGAISFAPPKDKIIKEHKDLWDHPELIVIVYFGSATGGGRRLL